MTAPRPAAVAARRLERPRWTDTRLLLGVLLVLGSVVLGSRVVASAQMVRPSWAASRDLPAGTVLRAEDLTPVEVRLDLAAGLYLPVGGRSPVGLELGRPVARGELVPGAAVGPADSGPPRHLVSLPVEALHYPAGLDRGDVVDVYVTAGDPAASSATAGSAAIASPQRVLADATVVEVDDDGTRLGGSGTTAAVMLSVGDGDVPGLVGALRSGAVDLVLVGNR